MEKSKSLLIGLWKFREGVPFESLIKMAEKWAQDENYLQVYIRKVSKDQNGIGFVYTHDGTKDYQDEYFDQTSDQLKREFGNGLVGWDIASTTNLIKGF